MTIVRRWCVCDCKKRHTTAGIGPATVCSCGRKLWARAFDDSAPQDPPSGKEQQP